MHIKLLPFEGLAEMFVHLHFKDKPEFAGFCFCGLFLGFKNQCNFNLCPVCSCNQNFIWAPLTVATVVKFSGCCFKNKHHLMENHLYGHGFIVLISFGSW